MCRSAGKYTIPGEKSLPLPVPGKTGSITLANGRALCYNG